MRIHVSTRRPPPWRVAILAAVLGGLVVSSALAATIVGTAGNDVLRGTAKADRLICKGGNDRLFGLAGTTTSRAGRVSIGTSAVRDAIRPSPHRARMLRRTARS